jgi:hypothetical protein
MAVKRPDYQWPDPDRVRRAVGDDAAKTAGQSPPAEPDEKSKPAPKG